MQYFGRRQSNSNCNDKMSRWATSWHSISLSAQNITFFADNSFFGQNILTHYHKNFLLVKRIFIVFIMLYSYLPERCKIQIVKCWIRRKICVPEGDKELATVTSVELCTSGASKIRIFFLSCNQCMCMDFNTAETMICFNCALNRTTRMRYSSYCCCYTYDKAPAIHPLTLIIVLIIKVDSNSYDNRSFL